MHPFCMPRSVLAGASLCKHVHVPMLAFTSIHRETLVCVTQKKKKNFVWSFDDIKCTFMLSCAEMCYNQYGWQLKKLEELCRYVH